MVGNNNQNNQNSQIIGNTDLLAFFNEKFAGIDKKLDAFQDQFDQKLNGLENRFDQKLDAFQDQFDQKLNGLENRFDKKLSAFQDQFDQKLNGLESRFDKKLSAFQDQFDQKLNGLENRFDKKLDALEGRLDGKLDSLQAQNVSDYQGLVDLMVSQFEKVYEKLDQKADKSDIDGVLTRVAMLANKVDDYRAEEIGLNRQVEKHEKWHHQTAAKIGLKFQAE